MSNRIAMIIRCLLLSSASVAVYGQTVPACGQVLGSYKGASAYSNGPDQWTEESCSSLGTFGYQYQCVEYVKRFYYQVLGINRALHWTGDALNYFASAGADVPSVFANNKMLTAVSNGGPAPPAPDDILVFRGPNGAGHVAIVTDVTITQVSFIEQNWSLTGTSMLSLSETCDLTSCSFMVANRTGAHGSVFTVLGWLRAPERTIFSNLSLSSFFNIASSWAIGSGCISSCAQPAQQAVATPFIPSETLRLSSVQVAASYFNGPNQLTVYLAQGDNQPGIPIESFSFTNLPTSTVASLQPTVVTGISLSNPELISGAKYWIVVTTMDLVDSSLTWQDGSPNFGTVAIESFFTGGVWKLLPGQPGAFSVVGIP